MWTVEKINIRLNQAKLSGEVWGVRGERAIENIEQNLSIKLGNELREFIRDVGNLRVDPFEVLISGDGTNITNSVTETLRLRQMNPSLKGIQLMAHAGEVYLYDPDTERVCAYDSLRPVLGEETLTWDNFDSFMNWVFTEAVAISKDTGFSF